MDWIVALDWQLMELLNFDGGPVVDALMYGISYKFTWVPLYLLLVWLAWRKYCDWRQLLLFVVITAFIVLLSDQISSGLIKNTVQRPRPSHQPGIMELLHYVNEYKGGAYGFVSSHASNTIAIAVWIYYYLTRNVVNPLKHKTLLLWVLILFVVLNCYSRIYLGVHYLGDILGGLAVGLFSVKMGIAMYQRLNYWIAKRNNKTTK